MVEDSPVTVLSALPERSRCWFFGASDWERGPYNEPVSLATHKYNAVISFNRIVCHSGWLSGA
jgi:hypothetical protein